MPHRPDHGDVEYTGLAPRKSKSESESPTARASCRDRTRASCGSYRGPRSAEIERPVQPRALLPAKYPLFSDAPGIPLHREPRYASDSPWYARTDTVSLADVSGCR